MAGKCIKCGQTIEFRQVKKCGTWYPIEDEQAWFEDLEDGQRLITTGGVLYWKNPNSEDLPSVKGNIIHFDVCRG